LANIAQIVSGLRKSIGDQKSEVTNIVKEPVTTATGGTPEVFYTKNMPIVSGNTVQMYSDRWLYTLVATTGAGLGTRAYLFDYDEGKFTIFDGATAATSGDTIYATYSYTEQMDYEYQDSELYEYVKDGVDWLNQYRNMGLSGVGVGTGITLSPQPSGVNAVLIAMTAKYLVQKDREESGIIDGIMIKELDITIDTTKNARARLESAKAMRADLLDIVYKMNLDSTAGAAKLVDTYSTWIAGGGEDKVGTDYETNSADGPFGLGEGVE